MVETYSGPLETTHLLNLAPAKHPALVFFRSLTKNRSYWQRLCRESDMPDALRGEIEKLCQYETLENLNYVILEILDDPDIVAYLNKSIKQDAKKALLVTFIRALCGSLSIAEFALNNAKITGDNFSKLFGITIPAWLLLSSAIICIIANGPFLAVIFKECSEQIVDISQRIKGVINSSMSLAYKVFVGVPGWILVELLVYTFGFLSASGDYKQAFGINWISFIATIFSSFLNGVISFYGFKEPCVDCYDYLQQGNTLSSLFTKQNGILLAKILSLSAIAYAGIAPPAFLAQKYENGSAILMFLTQSATVGASLLFSYKFFAKNSIVWPKERDKKIVVASSATFYLFSGINMLAAFTMLIVDAPFAPPIILGFFCALIFFCAGLYNGLASVPISIDIHDNVKQIVNKNPFYEKLKELLIAERIAGELQESAELLEIKLTEAQQDSASSSCLPTLCAPAPRSRPHYVAL